MNPRRKVPSHYRVHAAAAGGVSDAAPVGLARGRHSTLIAQPRSSRSPVHAGVAAPDPIATPAAASRPSTGASAAPVQRGGSGTSGSGRPSARVKRTAPRVVERHPQAAFVRRPMMPPAELRQVVEPGRPPCAQCRT